MNNTFDFAVVGGGLVGMAIAYGLAKRGQRVVVLDGEDSSFRAARGNFGLIWVSGKGRKQPDYGRWSLESSHLWPAFAEELEAASGLSLGYSKPGGLNIALTEESLSASIENVDYLYRQDARLGYEVLDHRQLKALVPEIADDVVGAVYSANDGHVSPLYTLRALFAAFERAGGIYVPNATVATIDGSTGGYRLDTGTATFRSARIVLCAGLGNRDLAPMVGLDAPVVPLRGQILVTERVRPFLHYPTLSVRQTAEGSVLLGESAEDVGMDAGVSADIVAHIARKAVKPFPLMHSVNVVRAWGALRVMTPDSMPIYEESPTCPGAFLATCHSGVTLAAAHCERLVPWLLGGQRPPILDYFHARRFHV
ncbi:FAD-dependent oxidoreductase [Burkholderia sp. BCC0405]|uniref:NAD(P)/FAD-dependent oxidoreductase n=1 Tax=Burkholderia sp. BCC0405 TaxID=2676298 RepID=UPI00158D234B|nr:FAD-dependent oxidoreductase [Burkholderia sp. BCC0405]